MSASAIPKHEIRPTPEEIDKEIARLDDLIVKAKKGSENPDELRKVVDEQTAKAEGEYQTALKALEQRCDRTDAKDQLQALRGQLAGATDAEKKTIGQQMKPYQDELARADKAFREGKAALDEKLDEERDRISKLPEQKVLDAMRVLPQLTSKAEVLKAVYKCPGGPMPHGGPCPICQKSHQVNRDEKAIDAAKQLWKTVKENPAAAGLSPDEAKKLGEQGSMLGVLFCKDANDKVVTLRAFSKNMAIDPTSQWESGFWAVTSKVNTLHAPSGVTKVINEAANDPPKLDSVVGQCAAPRMLDYVANFPQSAHETLDKAYMDAAKHAADKLGLKVPPAANPGEVPAQLKDTAKQLEAEVNKAKSALAENYRTKSDANGLYVSRAKETDINKDGTTRAEIQNAIEGMGPAVLNLPGVQEDLKAVRDLLGSEPDKKADRKLKDQWSTDVAKAFDKFAGQIDPALKQEQKRLLEMPEKLAARKANLPKGPLKPQSMAEIWVGKAVSETSWPPKVDGDIYDSCLTCHSTLGYALCDHKH